MQIYERQATCKADFLRHIANLNIEHAKSATSLRNGAVDSIFCRVCSVYILYTADG